MLEVVLDLPIETVIIPDLIDSQSLIMAKITSFSGYFPVYFNGSWVYTNLWGKSNCYSFT